MTKERKQEIINTYKREENDTGSPEVQIALLTERIFKKIKNSVAISYAIFYKKLVEMLDVRLKFILKSQDVWKN